MVDTAHKPSPASASSLSTPSDGSKKKKWVVDRNPPKEGEPHTRPNQFTGKDEFWCDKCPHGGRWGNHSTEKHNQWFKEFNEKKKKKEAAEAEARTTANVDSQEQQPPERPAMMHRDRATVCQSTRTGEPSTYSSRVKTMLHRAYVSFQDSDDESV